MTDYLTEHFVVIELIIFPVGFLIGYFGAALWEKWRG